MCVCVHVCLCSLKYLRAKCATCPCSRVYKCSAFVCVGEDVIECVCACACACACVYCRYLWAKCVTGRCSRGGAFRTRPFPARISSGKTPDWCVLQCIAVCYSVLQCFAVRCSALQRVAVCCSVLQCVAVCCSVLQCVAVCCGVLQCVAVCCNMLHCVATCCTVLHCVATCCSVLQCAAVCCSVLQCVAGCCRVLQGIFPHKTIAEAFILWQHARRSNFSKVSFFVILHSKISILRIVSAPCSAGKTPDRWTCTLVQCVAVCSSVSQCVAMCCSGLQCVAMCCNALQFVARYFSAHDQSRFILWQHAQQVEFLKSQLLRHCTT